MSTSPDVAALYEPPPPLLLPQGVRSLIFALADFKDISHSFGTFELSA